MGYAVVRKPHGVPVRSASRRRDPLRHVLFRDRNAQPRGIGAFIETILGLGDPTQDEVDERYLTSCDVRGVLHLADLTNPLALGYGVDGSFSASRSGDYDHSQMLAATLFDAGFDGIWYPLRHDPASDLMGMALFGEAASTDASRFDDVKTGPVPRDVLDEALTRFGIRVIPGPRLLR